MQRSEFELIARIDKLLGKKSNDVLVGIGDDTAVVRPPKIFQLLTVDTLIENVHFSRKFSKPEEIGHKSLAVNLSDIAAMGGTPMYALVSLGIPSSISDSWILKFYTGMNQLARKFRVGIIGGNISNSEEFFSSVTVVGMAKRPILRTGAKVGDWVGVTGNIGDSSAGFHMMRKRAGKKFERIKRKHRMPHPRVLEGLKLSKVKGVHSLIDISDGLSSELFHIASGSKVGFLIEEDKIPVSAELKAAAKYLRQDFRDWIWNGGEDYELLVTFSPQAFQAIAPFITLIGRVVPAQEGIKKVVNGRAESIQPRGWNHFRN